MTAPTLTTQRLSIEPMSRAHWEDDAAAWADPRMTAFIGGEPRSRNVSWGKMLQGLGLWSLFGYGTEAMTAILDWADAQALGEIRCIIDTGNTASHNVAGKLGFTKFAESHDVIGDLFIYRREPRISQ